MMVMGDGSGGEERNGEERRGEKKGRERERKRRRDEKYYRHMPVLLRARYFVERRKRKVGFVTNHFEIFFEKSFLSE